MKVQDVMVHDVITIEPSASLVDAAKRMREANVGVLPVVQDDRTVQAIITDRDVVVRAIARNADLSSIAVGDCATADAICAHPDWDVNRAMEVMAGAQVGRLPVVDDDNRLVGIVTLSSLALRAREDREALKAAKKVSHRSVKGPTEPSRRSVKKAS